MSYGGAGRPSRILPQIGILLDFEERLGVVAGRLVESDDSGSGRISNAISREFTRGSLDLDCSGGEGFQEFVDCQAIVLGFGYEVGVGRLRAGHYSLVYLIVVAQPLAPVSRSVFEKSQRGNAVILHDLFECPFAALPRHWMIPGAGGGIESPLLAELLLLDFDWRGEA